MRLKNTTRMLVCGLAAAAGFIAVIHSLSGVTPVLAYSPPRGQLHITKLCPTYTGAAGDHCTVATSNITELPSGTTVYYDQAFGIPAGNLDSNIMIYVSSGNWAVGRCTVEGATGHGLAQLPMASGRWPGSEPV